MARSVKVVYHTESAYKAWKCLVAARFNGIQNVETVEYNGKTPMPAENVWQKLPYLECDSGIVAHSNAMARYVARMRADTGIYGERWAQECQVDEWLEFCTQEIEIPGNVLVWSHLKYMTDIPQKALDSANEDLKKSLQQVEKHLQSSSYLVGDRLTLADIAVVCSLVDLFTQVLDKKFRAAFPKTEAWYLRCAGMPQFQAVLGGQVLQLCDAAKAAPAAKAAEPKKDNNATKAAKKQEQPKKEKAPEAPKAAAPAAAAPAADAPALKGSPEEQAALAAAKEKVRDLKAQGADKAVIGAAVDEMKRLKEICGEVDPPKTKGKKK